MELRSYTRVIWKWLWLVVLAAVVAAISSYFTVNSAPRLYQTKTTIMVGRFIEDPDPSGTQFYTSQQLAQTYVQIVRRQPVLQGALDALNLSDKMSWESLAGKVAANLIAGTQLIEIYVTDTNPQRAQALADAVAQELIRQSPSNPSAEQEDRREFADEQMVELEGKITQAKIKVAELEAERDATISARQIQNLQSQINSIQDKISYWQSSYAQFLTFLQGGDVNYLTIIEPARLPTFPISPNTMMNVLLAVATAVILALGAAFLIEHLDDTVKTPEDVERTVTLSTLGGIVRIADEGNTQAPIAAREPRTQVVEAYRALRTNVQFATVERPVQTLIVTSPNPTEGKSTTASNLAVVMAQSGLSTTLVDADLRRSMLHLKFNLPNAGLTTALLADEDSSVLDFLQETSVENLRVMTSGSLPPNPAELLGSTRMKRLLKTLEEESDLVILDTPPALAVTDAAILAAQADGIVLVVDAGRTRRNQLKRAVEVLDRTGTPILGVVINRLTARAGGYYYYYYYHGYYRSNGREQPTTFVERIPLVKTMVRRPDDEREIESIRHRVK